MWTMVAGQFFAKRKHTAKQSQRDIMIGRIHTYKQYAIKYV